MTHVVVEGIQGRLKKAAPIPLPPHELPKILLEELVRTKSLPGGVALHGPPAGFDGVGMPPRSRIHVVEAVVDYVVLVAFCEVRDFVIRAPSVRNNDAARLNKLANLGNQGSSATVLYDDGKKTATALAPVAIWYDFNAAEHPLRVDVVAAVVLPLPKSALEQCRTDNT